MCGCSCSVLSPNPTSNPHSFALICGPDALISAGRLTIESPLYSPLLVAGWGGGYCSSLAHRPAPHPSRLAQVSGSHTPPSLASPPPPPADFICLTWLALALPFPASPPSQSGPGQASSSGSRGAGDRQASQLRESGGAWEAETWEKSSQSPSKRELAGSALWDWGPTGRAQAGLGLMRRT